MIQVEYQEGERIIRDFECGECGGTLVLTWGGRYDVEGYVVKCAKDQEHSTIRKIRSITQAYRQGEAVPAEAREKVERRMMPVEVDINQALNILAIRYPSAELDKPSASLFLVDCMRLGLDPLLGEATPVAFFNRKLGKKIVTPIITEDGYLSMAARACPDRWAGPPSVEPVTDPALKKEICDDENGWVWKAIGRTRDMEPGQVSTAYGWFKTRERELAQQRGTPAGGLPGNQARVRAIKRWVRENFPEARARMKELTAEWMAEARGVREAEAIIEAEYTVFKAEPPGEGDHEEGESAPEPPVAPGETSDTAQGETRASSEAGASTAGPAPLQQAWDEVRRGLVELGGDARQKTARWLAMTSGKDVPVAIFDGEKPPVKVISPALVYQLQQKVSEEVQGQSAPGRRLL
jgi:hypothetical protein